MSSFVISGGRPLVGSVEIQGAKNSALPLLSACLLTKDIVTLSNVPDISDTVNMLKLLSSLGAEVRYENEVAVVDSSSVTSNEIPVELAKELRSSIFLLGSILARRGTARLPYPGGCDIGLRPIDLHLKALREMGVDVTEEGGYVTCRCSNLEATNVTLDYPSVGATENVMLLATVVEGVTTVANAAAEPEIEDLQNFINAMGGEISGAGTPFIKIKGGKPLKGTKFNVMPDRIEAGTYLAGALLCGGDVTLRGAKDTHLLSLLSKISKWDCKIESSSDKIHITSNGKLGELGVIETKPYPGFPTDLQAVVCTVASLAKGSTMIVENLFENRFRHLPELKKMGAKVQVKDKIAVFNGVKALKPASITAMDLRGGAALLLAGLCTKGETTVGGVKYVERGYSNIVEKLRRLGAQVKKV